MSTILGDFPIGTVNQLFFIVMLNLIPLNLGSLGNNAGGIGSRTERPGARDEIPYRDLGAV